MLKPISVVIITLNEEENIERCIQSCLDITEEIIVVDSGSQDRTIEIAKSLGAKVHSAAWSGYGNAKNQGANLASNNWILSIDADEELSQSLIQSIKHTNFNRSNIYAFNRKTKLEEYWVKYSGWHPQYLNRIYHKQDCHWNQDHVHEQIICNSTSKRIILKGLLLHYSFKNKKDYEQRQIKYAELRAQQFKSKGIKPSLVRKSLGPLGRFLTIFLFKRGFLDGRLGWYIATKEAEMMAKAFKLLEEKDIL